MFNQVDITLGDRLITQSDSMYTYRAYIESILNYSSNALDTQLSAGLFFKDTLAHFEDKELDGNIKSFVKRASFATSSREFNLLLPIHSDLFFKDELLINGIDLKVKLNHNKDSFCLINRDAEQYKLVILSASLFVKTVNVPPNVRLAHTKALQLLTAKYAIGKVALKTFIIPPSTRLTQQPSLFFRQLPKLITIGFADNTGFSSLYTSNPFNFKHYNINYMALFQGGAVIPEKPCTPIFGDANFFREYLGLVSIARRHLCDSGVIESREGYMSSYTLFAIDMTPDKEEGHHYSLIKNGNLKPQIRFRQRLAANEKIVVFSVFGNVIKINHAQNILFEYLENIVKQTLFRFRIS
ncbi:uncharacterized protein F54H12.2-like [Pleurodeles waltl]|uniref:uncharacterized protein F54H12.2-like n=1 Tax=Pleurodeles waltl TaxID=8319 RepID=UPI003709906C